MLRSPNSRTINHDEMAFSKSPAGGLNKSVQIHGGNSHELPYHTSQTQKKPLLIDDGGVKHRDQIDAGQHYFRMRESLNPHA